MNEGHMETVVSMIDKVLLDTDNEATLTSVKNDVHAFMKQFPLYPELG
jgi:glycine hydroxymethyltransferase